MYSSLRTLVVILVMMLTLNGCGDLLGTNVKKKGLDTSSITNLNCELDMNRFAEIMNEIIESDIRCLGENLNLFIRIVKSGKPGYLSLVQLEQYLANHRPDVKPEVVRALKSVFDLGHLITGEEIGYISKETVDKVISFAIIFNREAALNFGPIFRNETPTSYILHESNRDKIKMASKSVINSLRPIFNSNRPNINSINIIQLLEGFSTETNREYIDRAKKVLFLKKIILGGENEVVTNLELERLILRFEPLLLIGLDIIRYKHLILKQDTILHMLKRDVNDLFTIITEGELNNRDNVLMFTVNEAITAAKLFLNEDDFDIEKFRGLIVELKKIVMKGNATDVRGIELKNLFGHAKSILQTGTVFHRIYESLKVDLNRKEELKPDLFDDYRYNYPEQEKELNQFERIARKYRFQKGEFQSPYYIRGSMRNPSAFFEIALFEYGLQLVFSAYGSPSPNGDAVGGYSINKDQMQKLVMKFRNELIDLDLITPGREIGTADNISLLGTLFQYQSDKNGVMDVNEATEFGVALFSSMNIADDVYSYMRDKDCKVDEHERIEPNCFKENFWKGLCTYYRPYYPLLFEFLNAPVGMNCEDIKTSPQLDTANAIFLQRAINAARSCNYYTDGAKEEIYFSKGDAMTVMLALSHAETTVLRWDVNGNNQMDADEVMKAYEIYSPALDGFLEGKNAIIKKFKKQIYQYMIKYEQVPNEKDFGSIWKFVKFLLSFNKKAPASRKTIVALLDVIGVENAKLQTGPQFDCNLLRNPDDIPRDFTKSLKPVAAKTTGPEVSQILNWTVSKLKTYSEQDIEILKDEMYIFSGEMSLGNLSQIKNVRQQNIKRLFQEIQSNRAEMDRINSLVKEGSDLHKIAFAVSSLLVDL